MLFVYSFKILLLVTCLLGIWQWTTSPTLLTMIMILIILTNWASTFMVWLIILWWVMNWPCTLRINLEFIGLVMAKQKYFLSTHEFKLVRASSRIFCKGGQVLGSMKRGGAKLVVNLDIQSSLNSKGGREYTCWSCRNLEWESLLSFHLVRQILFFPSDFVSTL